LGIPLVFNSSKTYSEMRYLQDQMGLLDPMICENGSAIYLPKERFHRPQAAWENHGDFWRFSLAQSREHWLSILSEYPDQASILSFSYMGVQGVMNATGLDWAESERASQREYTEPLMPPTNDNIRQDLITYLGGRGAVVQQGGRFMTVGDSVDKGRAMEALACLWRQEYGLPVRTLALGDGLNDVAMLEKADRSVWIRSPVNPIPDFVKQKGWQITQGCGPSAWAAATQTWLEQHDHFLNSNKVKEHYG
jgi:mannosyl-3-phosphoglycerate phosphatase